MSEATLSERGRAMAKASTRSSIELLLSNLYHPRENPDGIIDMGTADNHPMTRDVSDFANSKIRTTSDTFTYGEGPWGRKRLRTAMANHMNNHFRPVSDVSPQDLIFSNGITSLLDLFGYAVASPGDGILISRPSYHAFSADFGARAEMKCVFVSFGSVDQFSAACVRNYESALLEARERGTCVRALLLCNPHNPLGRCYPVSTIIALMQFCDEYGLHLLADEVYALSVFTASSPSNVLFSSVLSVDHSAHISPNHLHVLYGMSKDFACSGLRLGCLYSRNTALMDSISALSHFGSTLQAEQPGWFRMVFTQEDDVLNEGLRRLFDAVGV
ncbi:PLP-dependent transferase [Aureobasidium sp. EXF-10728]|nr:PLP-dependent transferase [Aureobasidium sp. EXF-10728]